MLIYDKQNDYKLTVFQSEIVFKTFLKIVFFMKRVLFFSEIILTYLV